LSAVRPHLSLGLSEGSSGVDGDGLGSGGQCKAGGDVELVGATGNSLVGGTVSILSGGWIGCVEWRGADIGHEVEEERCDLAADRRVAERSLGAIDVATSYAKRGAVGDIRLFVEPGDSGKAGYVRACARRPATRTP
jgi:hypothetical protein